MVMACHCSQRYKCLVDFKFLLDVFCSLLYNDYAGGRCISRLVDTRLPQQGLFGIVTLEWRIQALKTWILASVFRYGIQEDVRHGMPSYILERQLLPTGPVLVREFVSATFVVERTDCCGLGQ